MSTLEFSDSFLPLVTRGIAVTPPVPLVALVPAAVRLNQVSRVKVGVSSARACPKVTCWFVPLNWRPVEATEGAAGSVGRRAAARPNAAGRMRDNKERA